MDYVEAREPAATDGIAFAQIVWVIVVAVLLFAAALALRFDAQQRNARLDVVHTYNGTTWKGDACYVDHDGVLWCTESG